MKKSNKHRTYIKSLNRLIDALRNLGFENQDFVTNSSGVWVSEAGGFRVMGSHSHEGSYTTSIDLRTDTGHLYVCATQSYEHEVKDVENK